MRFSLKITLSILIIVSLLFGLSSSLLVTLSFHKSIEREKEIAFESYQYALESIQSANQTNGELVYTQIALTVKQLYEQNKYIWSSVQLSNQEKVLYQSKLSIHDQHVNPQIGECQFYIHEYNNKQYLTVSGSFEMYNEVFYFETLQDISVLYNTREVQQRIFIGIFFIMIFICAIVSYHLSKILTFPLERLSKTSKEIAKGDFSSRVLISSNDEVGKVSQDFNIMADYLEDMIDKLQDTLNRQEEFMGSFAHELKTPMTSIIGYSDLMRSGTLNEEEQLEAIQYIFSESKRLEGLSLKLLRLLEIDKTSLTYQKISLNKLIESLVLQIDKVYESYHIDISCACEDVDINIETDLIKSLLMNLIDNARKAIDEQGHIFITLEKLEKGCCIYIYDDGRGIPKDSLSQLTDAFYRVDKSRSRKQGGTGLGLTLCKKIVDIHQGKISFESNEKTGTCVIVKLLGGQNETCE